MSAQDRKPRAVRIGKSSHIAAPPRVAIQGRSKAEHHDDAASTKSSKSVPDGNGSEDDTSSFSSSYCVRDRRIAELEKEMATMEHEFEMELTQLSHKLTSEAESSLFWQQKHSALNQTYLKTDTDLRLLRQEANSSQGDREEKERDIQTRISSLTIDRDAFREAYNEAMGEVGAKEDLVKALQSQVWGLKSFVSASSKMDEQIADEAFGEQMRRLGNSIQNWVISNFRRAKIDIEKLNDEFREYLTNLVPTYENLASSAKIHLIQSFVSRFLVDFIFQEYFVGLPKEHADQLSNVEKYLSQYGTVESINNWRSTTLAILQKDPSKLEETTNVIDLVASKINRVLNTISDAPTSESRDTSLRAFISNAIELSRSLRVQKAVFTVVMPSIEGHQQTMFDVQTMEDIGGEDEDTLNEREIRCVTFPGIVKAGDENGEKGHLRNVVAKIRVLCSPN